MERAIVSGRLMHTVLERALALGVPLAAHIDLTYRCNQRCLHCYLEHESPGEMSTSEIVGVLGQLAGAGTLFLTLSGGEIFLRRDLFDILASARRLDFSVKLKSNGTLIGGEEARRLKDLGVHDVDISVYSHRPAVHDAITLAPGSLEKSLAAIRALLEAGLKVRVSNVLMRQNEVDAPSVQRLASELGAAYTLDPSVTPKINGDRSVLAHRAGVEALRQVLGDPALAQETQPACETGGSAHDSLAANVPCSAGHSLVYLDPYGRVFPCVQFPLLCGNLREQPFAEIWKSSAALRQVRAVRISDLPVCAGCAHVADCSRCPGLAYLEGDMTGRSRVDCEKAAVRTGILPAII